MAVANHCKEVDVGPYLCDRMLDGVSKPTCLYHLVSLDEEQLNSLKRPKDFPKHTAGPSR